MLLAAQVRSTVLAEHFCVKLPENRRGRCSLASLALTSAVSQTTVSPQCPSFMARQPGYQSPSLPLRLKTLVRALRPRAPDAPTRA